MLVVAMMLQVPKGGDGGGERSRFGLQPSTMPASDPTLLRVPVGLMDYCIVVYCGVLQCS